MIPTAVLAGFVVGIWLRWWAVLVVGVGWAILIAFIDPTAVLGGGLLGAANALVGVLPALGLRKLAMRGTPRHDPC